MEKKVLVITYYWPPSGGSGVQRWLKFVKYLPESGWKPYVFTPDNPSFDVVDQSLSNDVPKEAEIIRFPIWEPYNAFMKLSRFVRGNNSINTADFITGTKKSYFQTISAWIRGNLFIPDPRVFWVRPSVRFLDTFLREHEITTIVTTGPPHSLHLIGYKLKRKNPSLRWVADFRDPWSDWGLLDSLGVGQVARRIHRKLEGKVLRCADRVLTITPFYVERFQQLSGRSVDLLTNGYDEDDFKELVIEHPEKFLIRHVGTINEKCNPRPFMEAVRQLTHENGLFGSFVHVNFVGNIHPEFKSFVEESREISSFTTFTPQVSHTALIRLYGQSALLLLILTGYKDAEGYMPGKLFEYLATGLPLLGTGPETGDASNLLKVTGAGTMIDEKDIKQIKLHLLRRFEEWQSRKVGPSKVAGEGYSRRALTRRLTELL